MTVIDRFSRAVEKMLTILDDSQKTLACRALRDLAHQHDPDEFAAEADDFVSEVKEDKDSKTSPSEKKHRNERRRLESPLRNEGIQVICARILGLSKVVSLRELRPMVQNDLDRIDAKSKTGAKSVIYDRATEAIRLGYLIETDRDDMRDDNGKLKQNATLRLDDLVEITAAGKTFVSGGESLPLHQAGLGNGHMQSMSGNNSGAANEKVSGSFHHPSNGFQSETSTSHQNGPNDVFAGQ